MEQVFLALGGNLGDRKHNLESALNMIDREIGHVVNLSSFYETKALTVDASVKAAYLNCAVQLETELSPEVAMDRIQKIEISLGRVRDPHARWESRTVDIDILLWGKEIINSPRLSVPHPEMHCRDFVLVPLAEIAPDLFFPGTEKRIAQLLEELEGERYVVGPV